MHGAEFLVDQPLQEHALEAGGDHPPFVAGRNLADVEVAEQVALRIGRVERRAIVGQPAVFREERVALHAGGLGCGAACCSQRTGDAPAFRQAWGVPTLMQP